MSQSAETPTKKTKKKVEESTETQITVAPEYLLQVTQQKLAEADNQNTLLRGLVMQQQAEINNLREALDALAKEPKNREQRRAKEKKANGKRK
jgi:hypothetical protein